jgi:hypothetical protein
MVRYRCPDPSHGGGATPLKSNNDKVFECELSHRYFRRIEGDAAQLVDLISGRAFEAAAFEDHPIGEDLEERARLNFMKDVPRVRGDLDFDALQLSPREWKVISKVDGRSTLEEIRLLAGMKADEAEALFYRLLDAGIIEMRSRGR